MPIVVCHDLRIGSCSRRVVINNPIRLFMLLFIVIYVEVLVRTYESTFVKKMDPPSVPFFVDIVSPDEEAFMRSMKKTVEWDSTTQEPCLQPSCLEKLSIQLARAYDKPSFGQWCVTNPPKGSTKDDYYGMLMVKVPKAASSTAAAVAIRIQNQTNIRLKKKCRIEFDHRLAINYAKAPASQRFLWSSIRDPTKRALSRIFFTDVSFKNHEPTDEYILKSLTRNHHKFGTVSTGQGGFQVKYTSLHNIPEMSAWKEENQTVVQRPERIVLSVKRIMDSYGFLALVERMDESLVVLSMLMDIPLTDVLISSNSKVAGNSYFMRFGNCVKLAKAFVSPAVKQYLESKVWLAQNYGDHLLHMTVNKSLDKTIDERLGREAFVRKLDEYMRLKKLDTQYCAPTTLLPCSKDGVNQVGASRGNCYKEDYGCGYPCVDNLLKNNTLHSSQQRAIWKPLSSSWFQR